MKEIDDFTSYFINTKEKKDSKFKPDYSLDFSYKTLLKTKDVHNRFVLDYVISTNNPSIKKLTSLDGDSLNMWIKGDDFKVFVKTIDEPPYMEYAPQIYYELASQIGLDTLEYNIALIDDKKFFISKNFVNEDEIALKGKDLVNSFAEKNRDNYSEIGHAYEDAIKCHCLEKVPTLLKSINKDVSSTQVKKIVGNLYFMHLLDLMCYTYDRHEDNWSVIFDLFGNVRLAPVYDNEWIFNFNMTPIYFERQSLEPTFPDVKGGNFHLSYEETMNAEMDLIRFTEKHIKKDTIKKIKNIVNNINIETAFENIETKNKEEMPAVVKKQTKRIFNSNQKKVIECLNVAIKHIDRRNKR